jgi:hypothetical protein
MSISADYMIKFLLHNTNKVLLSRVTPLNFNIQKAVQNKKTRAHDNSQRTE